uniref:TPR_REGION domain-containing protein n=1 Tax=Macrostomum lignano TaxID=282301 RepID=A0A1I8F6E3_9PLAT
MPRRSVGTMESGHESSEIISESEEFERTTCCFRSAILRKLERNDEAILHNIRWPQSRRLQSAASQDFAAFVVRRMLPHTELSSSMRYEGLECSPSKEGPSMPSKLLEVAQTYETEQLDFECLMLLSLANSYASRKYSEVATEVHDSSYQIKCLVSLPLCHLHSDNVAKATAYYQRLLDLRQDKAVINGDDWSPELECGLLLNLSICCGHSWQSGRAQCRSNFGLALLRAGQPELAKSSLEEALKHARKVGDPSLLASCQGLLGSVMAELRNAGLSAAYHEQQIINSRRCDDRDALARAHLASGDSLRLLGKFDSAVDSFAEAGRAAIRPEMKLLAEVKIGETHLSADRPQRALYHFDGRAPVLTSLPAEPGGARSRSAPAMDRRRSGSTSRPAPLLPGLGQLGAKRGKFERALLASEAAHGNEASATHLAGRQSLLSSDRFDGLGGGGAWWRVVANR